MIHPKLEIKKMFIKELRVIVVAKFLFIPFTAFSFTDFRFNVYNTKNTFVINNSKNLQGKVYHF